MMALGGSAEHATPAGFVRRASLSSTAVFARHFTVYVTSRKPGLAPGATMAGIAAGFAKAIEEDLGGPVVFHCTSAGGAVGLQLAISYPHLVRRLVLPAAACRLSPAGHQLLAGVARQVKAGHPRRASALVATALAPRPLRYPAATLAWLANPLAVRNPADMLITNAAVVALDARARTAPGAGTHPGDRRQHRPVLLPRTCSGAPPPESPAGAP